MRITSPRLRRLDAALADLAAESDAMMISDLDGYLAGVIVCPELILPGEWLPPVWGNGADGSLFADEREARWYAELVMEHYNAVVRTLNKDAGRYAPFLEVDARHDEVMWELWIEGFAQAMALRPDSWGAIVASGDGEALAALAGMTTLVLIAHDECDLDRAVIDQLTEAAPDMLGPWVAALNTWRLARHAAAPTPAAAARAAKVGRNDPCPCGSGRKFKKCCGAN